MRHKAHPLVVDLGFGASPITAVELLDRLLKINPNTQVVGIEIERERVERGLSVATKNLHFTHGGFETPLPSHLDAHATVIRAFNVLRQYDEGQVFEAWATMQSRLTDDGLLVEGTCDEIGRLSSWITLNRHEPMLFTISIRLKGLELPSKVAERLPKALIHHNQPGERIHDYLQALDAVWRANAGLGIFSPLQRWVACCEEMANSGWPIVIDRKRWKLGELSVDWNAVAPTAN